MPDNNNNDGLIEWLKKKKEEAGELVEEVKEEIKEVEVKKYKEGIAVAGILGLYLLFKDRS